MKRIVIIGASGHWGYALDGMSAYPDAVLAAVAPGHAEEADAVKNAYAEALSEGCEYYSDYREMMDRERPSVAVVNPYFYLNGAITIECLRRGIHCFTEKPLTFQLAELEEIKKLVAENRLHLSTMMAYRYHPAFYAAYRAVKDGLIGVPLQITAQKSYKNRLKPAWQHSRSKFGGLIAWVGSHALDWILWVTENGVGEVWALDTTLGNMGNGDMESSAICLFRLKNGGQAAANIDYLRPATASTHGDDRLRIAGTNGVVEVIAEKATLTTVDEGVRECALEEKRHMFAEFLKKVDGCDGYRQSMEDVFALTHLCIRAQQAADEHTLRPDALGQQEDLK